MAQADVADFVVGQIAEPIYLHPPRWSFGVLRKSAAKRRLLERGARMSGTRLTALGRPSRAVSEILLGVSIRPDHLKRSRGRLGRGGPV